MLSAHFIEFIDAASALIGEDESARFQSVLVPVSRSIFGQSHRQSGTGRRISANVDSFLK